MLHTHHAGKSFLMDVLEHIQVIDLAGRRLLASWVVTDLKVRYFTPRLVDVGDDIPFCDLLVVHVKGDFTEGTIYCFADLVGLGDLGQEHARVV